MVIYVLLYTCSSIIKAACEFFYSPRVGIRLSKHGQTSSISFVDIVYQQQVRTRSYLPQVLALRTKAADQGPLFKSEN